MTAAKTTVAASNAMKKAEPTPTPAVKTEKPGIRKAEPVKKDTETSKNGKVNEAKKDKTSTKREKDRRPVGSSLSATVSSRTIQSRLCAIGFCSSLPGSNHDAL